MYAAQVVVDCIYTGRLQVQAILRRTVLAQWQHTCRRDRLSHHRAGRHRPCYCIIPIELGAGPHIQPDINKHRIEQCSVGRVLSALKDGAATWQLILRSPLLFIETNIADWRAIAAEGYCLVLDTRLAVQQGTIGERVNFSPNNATLVVLLLCNTLTCSSH